MELSVTSTIAEVDRRQFDSLDRSAGFPSSYGRLLQQEHDPRWVARYLVGADGNRLRAVVPVYRSRMTSWPDAAYDPRTWGLPDGRGNQCTPEATLLVGGCAGRRTGLHVDAVDGTDTMRRLLVELATLAADEDRCLGFPHISAEARDALIAAGADHTVWTDPTREAHVAGLSDPAWESHLRKRVRQNLRDDRRLVETFAVTEKPEGGAPWDEVRSWAAELISQQHDAKGNPEPPEFVDFRYSELQENPDLEVVAFVAEAPGLRGVTTAVVWDGEMEVCEVGLPGEHGKVRLGVYLSVLFRQPFRYAQAHAIDRIRYGRTSESSKAGRGAEFTQWYSGVLDQEETRRLARGEAT